VSDEPAPRTTVNERVLVHLREAWVGQPSAPPASTQEGIATALAIRANHVSRAVRTLLAEGLVSRENARVRGEVRRRKVYALTSSGRQLADRLYADALHRQVVLQEAGQVAQRLPVATAVRLPGGPFSVTQVLTAMQATGTLRLSSLRGAAPALRLARVESGLPPPEALVGRAEEREAIAAWLRSSVPVLAVTGPVGCGKTALVAQAFREAAEGCHALWHTVTSGDTPASLAATLERFLDRMGKGSAHGKAPVPLAAGLRHRLRGQPALLVFDGVSAAGREAADWLHAACEAAAEAGAKVILATHRAPPAWAAWRVRGILEELPVHGLSMEDARLLVGPALPEAQLARLHRLAGGNALALRLASLSFKEATDEGLSDSEKSLLGFLRATRGR
jgi:DNA-binding MarR family transcriptional regulator